MSNKTYDTIKAIALLLVPIVAFAGSVVTILNVPYGAQITAILTALDACLGGIVTVASKLYKDKEEGESDE